MDREVENRINQALKNKEPVYINYNDETGDWLYAVVLHNEQCFWLDAFETKKEAEKFCKKNKLPIIS